MFVETWRKIAEYMDRSERWCRYMAVRVENPLPVYKFGGIMRSDIEALHEWMAKQNPPIKPTLHL